MMRSLQMRRTLAAAVAAASVLGWSSAWSAESDWLSYTRIEADVGRSGSETSRSLDAEGWVGGDTHRLRWRLGAESPRGFGEPRSLELMYSRRVADYWDVVAGVRDDRSEGGVSRTYAVLGVAGLAPYFFDVDATLAFGGGRALLDLDARHEMLLTQRVVLYPFLAIAAASRADPAIGLGSGLNRTDLGIGVRYEFSRRFGVYAAASRRTFHGGTADQAVGEGEERSANAVRVGLRTVF